MSEDSAYATETVTIGTVLVVFLILLTAIAAIYIVLVLCCVKSGDDHAKLRKTKISEDIIPPIYYDVDPLKIDDLREGMTSPSTFGMKLDL